MREYVLALDPSLSSTGWAIIDKKSKEVIDLGKICTTNKLSEDDRVMVIINTLIEKVDLYGIKEVASEAQFFGKNAKTAMQLSRLRGGIMVAVKLHGANIEYMQPSEIRQVFVGKGNASKEEVADAIISMYPDNLFVKNLGPFSDKSNKAKNSDMYDAISIGVSYIQRSDELISSQTA